MLDRISKIKQVYGITNRDLSERTGMQHDTIGKQLKGDRKLDVRILMVLADMCPSLSMDYLIRGVGPLQRTEQDDRYLFILHRLDELEQRMSEKNIAKT